jgi:hypothetical protein
MEKEGKAGRVCFASSATMRFKELYGDVQRVARGRRGQSGTESRAKLSKLPLERCVGRLCFGQISRLQISAESEKSLIEGRGEAVGGGRRGEARDIAGLNGVKV